MTFHALTGYQSGIYTIENMVTGKRYIGSAQSLIKRYRTHRTSLEKGYHTNIHLQRAWNKDGAAAFRFRALEICSGEQLIEREQAYIDALKPAYNIAPLAQSTRGKIASAETRRRLSESHRGNVDSPETRRRKSEAQRARWATRRLDPEWMKSLGQKMSRAHKGRSKVFSHNPEETRRRKTEATTGVNNPFYGRRHSQESKERMRAAAAARRARENAQAA